MSPICEGAGYDEVYSSGRKLEEDITWSPERESSAHSPADGEEYEEDEERGGDEGKERMKKEKMKRNKERVMWGSQEEGDRLVD